MQFSFYFVTHFFKYLISSWIKLRWLPSPLLDAFCKFDNSWCKILCKLLISTKFLIRHWFNTCSTWPTSKTSKAGITTDSSVKSIDSKMDKSRCCSDFFLTVCIIGNALESWLIKDSLGLWVLVIDSKNSPESLTNWDLWRVWHKTLA